MVTRGFDPAIRQRIDELVTALRSGDGAARERARRELCDIGPPATAALAKVMFDKSHQVRWEATKALSHICDPRASRFLVKALEDPDFDVRWIAESGLIRMNWGGVEPLLRVLARRHFSATTLQGAHRVVGRLVTSGREPSLTSVWTALNSPQPDIAVPPLAFAAMRELRDRRHARAALAHAHSR